jgi:uncharacterized membrane protein
MNPKSVYLPPTPGPDSSAWPSPLPTASTDLPRIPRPGRDMRPATRRMARGLGVVSLALGLAGVLAPREMSALAGLRRKHRRLVQTVGARELGHALAILAVPEPTVGVWSRVAGDVLDLSTLGAAYSDPRVNQRRLTTALLVVMGITAADVLVGRQLNRATRTGAQAIQVRKTKVINRPADELYRFWHNFQNLPQFMEHVQSVELTGPGRSRWVVRAPAGTSVEWEAEITEDRRDELIAWRTLPGASVPNRGRVQFRPALGNRGTLVTVELHYEPPAGKLGAAVAKLFGEEPVQQAAGDLRRFKQLMETGEVVRSDATLRSNKAFAQRPARPAAVPVPPQLVLPSRAEPQASAGTSEKG